MNFTREVAVVGSKHISKATGSCAEIFNGTHMRDSIQIMTTLPIISY